VPLVAVAEETVLVHRNCFCSSPKQIGCFGLSKLFLFVTKTDWFLVMGKCITLYCAVKFQLGTDPKFRKRRKLQSEEE
jgi:hypothetical protein